MMKDKIEKQGVEWPNIFMGMWNNVPYFTASSDVMEPFMKLAKSQQQHSKKISQTCVDFQRKLSETGHSGNIQKVTETCLELSGEFFRTWQESIKEQTLDFYKFWRTYIPILPGSLENRKGTAAKARPSKKAPVVKRKKPAKQSKVKTVLALIQDSQEGIATAELMEKTGMTDKQIWAIVYKAEKQGKIKKAKRGVYARA
jgi:hypothetical protein